MILLFLAAAGRVSDTSVLTGINLALIAAAMVVVVLAMLWGIRQKRRRADSEREALGRQEEMAVAPAAPIAAKVAAPSVPPPAAQPVTPKPEPEPTPPVAVPAPPVARPAEPAAPSAPPVTPPPPPLVEAPVGDAGGVPLTRLKGLGPKAAGLLGERGIADVAALAKLSDAQAVALDAELGAFAGRMAKDRWHEQAQLLAAGDVATYEATFGKLGG